MRPGEAGDEHCAGFRGVDESREGGLQEHQWRFRVGERDDQLSHDGQPYLRGRLDKDRDGQRDDAPAPAELEHRAGDHRSASGGEDRGEGGDGRLPGADGVRGEEQLRRGPVGDRAEQSGAIDASVHSDDAADAGYGEPETDLNPGRRERRTHDHEERQGLSVMSRGE